MATVYAVVRRSRIVKLCADSYDAERLVAAMVDGPGNVDILGRRIIDERLFNVVPVEVERK
jgi:hypothetical protein